MPKYRVQWNYQSGLGGPWKAGDEVEMEEWRYRHINVDSPGVLKVIVEGEKLPKVTRGKTGKDRQVKTAANRGQVMGRDQEGYGRALLPDVEED